MDAQVHVNDETIPVEASILQKEFTFQQPAEAGQYPKLWDEDILFRVPAAVPATDLNFDFEVPEGLSPVYLEGLEHHGKPTRFFAWTGVPASNDGRPVPGIVLVHGGGGTAFARWAGDWYKRGYAVIAMDTVSCRPLKAFEGQDCREYLEGAGPVVMDLEKDADTPADNWVSYAVGTIVRSHSYLRSLPGVDASRIGITGISWGGFLTCVTCAVDRRFAAAVPVYGCGFLKEASWTVKGAPDRWLKLFDPCMFLKSVETPMLFVSSPTDLPYHWPQWIRSSLLVEKSQRSCRVGLQHSHFHGITNEVFTFIDSFCKEAPKLPVFGQEKQADGCLMAEFSASAPIEKATLAWTTDDSYVSWHERKWQETDAAIVDGWVRAELPSGAAAAFLCIHDSRGCIVSTCGWGWK